MNHGAASPGARARLSRLSEGTWKIKKPLERLTKKSTRRPGAQCKWFPCAAMLAEIAQALEGNHVVAANSIGHNRGKKRQGQTADCSTKTKSKQCSTSKKECKNISARGQCVRCAIAEATRAKLAVRLYTFLPMFPCTKECVDHRECGGHVAGIIDASVFSFPVLSVYFTRYL